MAVRKKTELPHGWNYRIIPGKKGLIDPKKGEAPIVRISGADFCIEYGLTNLKVIEHSYRPGSLCTEQIDFIQNWVELQLPALSRDAELHHFLRFRSESPCYYDFDLKLLFNANGKKERIGELNGKSCKLSKGELGIIELISSAPNYPFTEESVCANAGISASSLSTTMTRLRNYDSSLRESLPVRDSDIVYKGNPQSWVVGKDYLELDHPDEAALTAADVFSVMAYPEVICYPAQVISAGVLPIRMRRELTAVNKLSFLLPDVVLKHFDLRDGSAELLMRGELTDSGALLDFYRTAVAAFETLWQEVSGNLFRSLSLSIAATTYFNNEGSLPAKASELNEYHISSKKAPKRICVPLSELIDKGDTCRLFDGLSRSVGEESAYDYATVLLLSCMLYLRCPQTDELIQLRQLYRRLLRETAQMHLPFDGGNLTDSGQFSELTDLELLRVTVEYMLELFHRRGLEHNDRIILLESVIGRDEMDYLGLEQDALTR